MSFADVIRNCLISTNHVVKCLEPCVIPYGNYDILDLLSAFFNCFMCNMHNIQTNVYDWFRPVHDKITFCFWLLKWEHPCTWKKAWILTLSVGALFPCLMICLHIERKFSNKTFCSIMRMSSIALLTNSTYWSQIT